MSPKILTVQPISITLPHAEDPKRLPQRYSQVKRVLSRGTTQVTVLSCFSGDENDVTPPQTASGNYILKG